MHFPFPDPGLFDPCSSAPAIKSPIHKLTPTPPDMLAWNGHSCPLLLTLIFISTLI